MTKQAEIAETGDGKKFERAKREILTCWPLVNQRDLYWAIRTGGLRVQDNVGGCGGFLVWFNIRIDGGLAGTELQCWGALDLSEIWPGSTIPASATLRYKKLEQNTVELFLYVSKHAECAKK